MRQIALHLGPYAGDEIEVARLAVTLPQAHENAHDLGIALGAEQGIICAEYGRIHPGGGYVPRQHRFFQGWRHITPRILQQAHQIIGGMANQRILKIE